MKMRLLVVVLVWLFAGSHPAAQRVVIFNTTADEVENGAGSVSWPENPLTRVKRVAPIWPNVEQDVTGVVHL